MPDKCRWEKQETGIPDDYSIYDTSCKNIALFEDGTVAENNYKFCQFCGNEIEEVSDNGK